MQNYYKSLTVKQLLIILSCTLAIIIYASLNMHQFVWYRSSGKHVCKTPKKEMDDLLALIRDVHLVLKKLDMTHFLIYGR